MAPRQGFDITRTRSGKAIWRCALAGLCAVFVRAGEAEAYKAYVSNEKGNTISVIDTGERKVVGTIKVGQRPRGIALTRDQKYVLVAVGDDVAFGAGPGAVHR
jgi:YVTN family beta-propeller protein